MEKITLKLGEILQLESELNGLKHPENGDIIYKGFLKTNLSIFLKYELMTLSEFLLNERKKIDSLRDSLVLKYGEKNEKGDTNLELLIEQDDTKIVNPKYVEFDNEFKTFLNEEKEIEYPEISKDDLKNAGNSTDNYKILFKLIK